MKILVVDEEQLLVKGIKFNLESEGYQVEAGYDGEEAVELARANAIPYAVDIYPHYGSDVAAAWEAGMDARGALIGPGVHASHGMERTHIDALMATLRLIALYAALG